MDLTPIISRSIPEHPGASRQFRQVELVLTEAIAKLGDFGVAKAPRRVGHSTAELSTAAGVQSSADPGCRPRDVKHGKLDAS